MCLYTQMSFSFCSDIQLFYYFLPVMAFIGAIVKVYKKKDSIRAISTFFIRRTVCTKYIHPE